MFGDRSFAITAPRRWNTLAKGIRDTNSLVIFNTLLKTHFCIQIYGHKLFVFWTMHRHCQTRLFTVLLKSCRFLILFSVVFSCISCLNYNDTVFFALEKVIIVAAMLNSHLSDSDFDLDFFIMFYMIVVFNIYIKLYCKLFKTRMKTVLHKYSI